MGLGLPIVSTIATAVAYFRLKRTGQTSWDEDCDFTVEATSLGAVRWIVAVGINLALIFGGMFADHLNMEEMKIWTASRHTASVQSPESALAQNETNKHSWNEDLVTEPATPTPVTDGIESDKVIRHQASQSIPSDIEWYPTPMQPESTTAKWYRKAAEQGNADAQIHLGIIYEKGQGVAGMCQ